MPRLTAALAGLCAGIVHGFSSESLALPLGAGIVSVVLARARRRPVLRVAGIALLAFALGAADAAARSPRGTPLEQLARTVPRCSVTGTAREAEGALGSLVAIESLDCGEGPLTATGAVFVERPMPAGAVLEGDGWLVPLGDDAFDAARRRFGAAAELATDDLTVRGPRAGPLAVAATIRAGLGAATRSLPADRAALLTGVTTGETERLGDDVVSDFRRSGLAHLVAVSGENVVMVLGALALVTRRLGARTRAVAALSLLGLFVLVVGPQPSVTRAAAMAVVAIAAFAYGLRPEPWHTLTLGLIAVASFRPAIVFSAGLHLSAAATAGILLWARPLAARVPLAAPISTGLGVTLAAQLATAPLVVGLFGQVSVAGPVANLLALPAVPPATVLGLCASVAGTVSAPAGAVVARIAEPFVAWILLVARTFGRPSWAALAVPRGYAWALGTAAVAAALVAASRNVRVGP